MASREHTADAKAGWLLYQATLPGIKMLFVTCDFLSARIEGMETAL
jgi:hypothetical protein